MVFFPDSCLFLEVVQDFRFEAPLEFQGILQVTHRRERDGAVSEGKEEVLEDRKKK